MDSGKFKKTNNFIKVTRTWNDYIVIYDEEKKCLNKVVLNRITVYYR